MKNKKNNAFSILYLVCGLIVFIPSLVYAQCADPVGNMGQVIYNGDTNAPQYCNGSDWIALGIVNPSAGGAGCTNPVAPEGKIIYNGDVHVPQYCDGDDWIAMIGYISGGGSGGHGYFVFSSTNWNGNLGGLSGADAKCLTELQNLDWMGKTDANNRGLLIADKVKAFLCDKSQCNNLEPSTPYFYARAGNTSFGGSGFITDENGAGPGIVHYWDYGWVFDTPPTQEYWSNRSQGTSTHWGLTPAFTADNQTCSGFTSSSGSQTGRTGAINYNNFGRWYASWNTDCSTSQWGRLICFINP